MVYYVFLVHIFLVLVGTDICSSKCKDGSKLLQSWQIKNLNSIEFRVSILKLLRLKCTAFRVLLCVETTYFVAVFCSNIQTTEMTSNRKVLKVF